MPRRWRMPTTRWGAILDAIEDLGQLDNTLVIYIQGDNGASAEGGFNGLLNEMTFFNGIPRRLQRSPQADGRTGFGDDLQPLPDRLGARDEHAVSVDQAGRLALRWHAQRTGHLVAGAHQGQGRHPHAIPPCDRHRADHSGSGGRAIAVRAQRRAAEADRRRQHGSTPSTTPKAPSRRRTQYFEMVANRAIYDDGWVACTTPPVTPWMSVWKPIDIDDYQWELYHVAEDFSQAVNLADKEPAKLRELAGPVLDRSRQIQRAADRQPSRGTNGRQPSSRARHGPFGLHVLCRTRPAFPKARRRTSRTSPSRLPPTWKYPRGAPMALIVTQGGRFGGWASMPARMASRLPLQHGRVSSIIPSMAKDKLAPGPSCADGVVRLRRWRCRQRRQSHHLGR